MRMAATGRTVSQWQPLCEAFASEKEADDFEIPARVLVVRCTKPAESVVHADQDSGRFRVGSERVRESLRGCVGGAGIFQACWPAGSKFCQLAGWAHVCLRGLHASTRVSKPFHLLDFEKFGVIGIGKIIERVPRILFADRTTFCRNTQARMEVYYSIQNLAAQGLGEH
jgi:hypothetical protein